MKPTAPTRRKYRGRGIRSLLTGGRCVDLGGDHRYTTLLLGSARSGTTWASRVLNPDDGMRYIFEPLHPTEARALRNLRGSPRRPYLRPGRPHPEYAAPVGAVLRGESRDRWSDRHNGRIIARRRLVKEVRANLMLGWLREEFPGMTTILLLRHPCAVVESRLRLGWRVGLEDFTAQPQLLEDYPEPLKTLLPSVDGDFERGVLAWCIENYVPLCALRNDAERGMKNTHIMRYEDLLLNPVVELDRLPLDLQRSAGGASRMARQTADLSREELAFGWRERVGDGLKSRTRELLCAFGMDVLYDEDGSPKPGGVETFLCGTSDP